MYGVWLASVLASAGMNSILPPAQPASVICASKDDVTSMLGQPTMQVAVLRGGVAFSAWHWYRVDWLGGRHSRHVFFADGVADNDQTTYRPFAATPPWLDALRDAFTARPTP